MTRAFLSAAAALVACASTRLLLRAAIPHAPLRRTNYRGVRVATGLGIVALAGVLCGVAVVGIVVALGAGSAEFEAIPYAALPLLAAAGGFALLGLWDDLYGAAGAPERGLRGHARALRQGRVTGGALKMIAGVALALAVAAPGASPGWLVVDGATIAMMANVFNGLDVRPGRAIKFFALAAFPLAIVGGAGGVTMSAAVGSVVAFLPDDLGERAMLGDAGAYALGALAGAGAVYATPPTWARLALAALLVVLTIAADGPGFSSLIGRVPGLRSLDRAGRVREGGAPGGPPGSEVAAPLR